MAREGLSNEMKARIGVWLGGPLVDRLLARLQQIRHGDEIFNTGYQTLGIE